MSKKIWEMTQDIQKRINEVAYMMWESAGRHQGMAMDFWLEAEREVLTTMQTAAEQLISVGMSTQKDASPAKTKQSVTADSESAASTPPTTPKPKKTEGKRAAAETRKSPASSSKRPAPSRPRSKS